MTWAKLLGGRYGPQIGWLYPLALLTPVTGLYWWLLPAVVAAELAWAAWLWHGYSGFLPWALWATWAASVLDLKYAGNSLDASAGPPTTRDVPASTGAISARTIPLRQQRGARLVAVTAASLPRLAALEDPG